MKESNMLHKYFSELNNKNIRYSHWKSNIRLAKSFRGKTDFDLLFDIDSRKRLKKLTTNMDLLGLSLRKKNHILILKII